MDLPGLPSDFLGDDFDLSWLTDGFGASPALPGASFGRLMPELAVAAAAAARASPVLPGMAPQPMGHAHADSSQHCNAGSPPSVQQQVPRPPSPPSCPSSHAAGHSHPKPECVQLHSQQSTASVADCMAGEGGSLPLGQGQHQPWQHQAQELAAQQAVLQQQPAHAKRHVTQGPAAGAGSGANGADASQEKLTLLLRYHQLRQLLKDRQRQQQQAAPSHPPAPVRDLQSLPMQGTAAPADPAPLPAFGSELHERQRSRSVPPQSATQPPEQQQTLSARYAERPSAAPNELQSSFAFEGTQEPQQYLQQQLRCPQQQQEPALEGVQQEAWKDPTEELLERQARHQQQLLEAYRQRQRVQREAQHAAAQRAQQLKSGPDRPDSGRGDSSGPAAPSNPQQRVHASAYPARAAPPTAVLLGAPPAPLISPFSSSQLLSAHAGLAQLAQQQPAGASSPPTAPLMQQQQQRAAQYFQRLASAYQPDPQLGQGQEERLPAQQQQRGQPAPIDHRYNTAPAAHAQHIASSFREELAEALATHPSLPQPRPASFERQAQWPGLARGREQSPQLQEPRRTAPGGATAAAPRHLSETARVLLQQGSIQPLPAPPAPPGVEEAAQQQGSRRKGGSRGAGRALQGSTAATQCPGQPPPQQPASDATAAAAAVLLEPASSESEDRASHSPKVAAAHGEVQRQEPQRLSAQEQARLKRIETARRTRKRKAEYVSGLEQQNIVLRGEVQRLTRVLRSWATQGFITPQQALEFLHIDLNNSQASALLDAGSLNLTNARQAQQ